MSWCLWAMDSIRLEREPQVLAKPVEIMCQGLEGFFNHGNIQSEYVSIFTIVEEEIKDLTDSFRKTLTKGVIARCHLKKKMRLEKPTTYNLRKMSDGI